MAKVQNPVIGRSKGSAGGMTFSKVYDKNIMKAKAFEVNNPNTAAQQTQRNFFKTVSAQSAKLTPEMLRTIFPSMPKGMSRRNAFTKQLAANTQVVAGVKTMNLAALMSIGNAPTFDFGTTTCTISEGTVAVGLDASLRANTEVNQNFFIVMLVNDTQNEIALGMDNAKVETGTLNITAPSGWENTDTVHAIPLITDSQVAITSWATLSVATRPERV